MTERQTVEATRESALAMCTCGWRSITRDRAAAWSEANLHGQRAHPGDNSRNSYWMDRRQR